METTEYNLIQLVPEFSRIWRGDVTSAEGLSAVFVFVLLLLVLLFSLWSLWNFKRARQSINFYRDLLKDLPADDLLNKRRDISNKAMASKYYGNLWREFDESLVHLPQKQRLCNTLDAEHFFNTHSLARGLTENRLLAAVPGFLTAVGVIGTFAGLQMGLSALSENMGETPEISQLTVGIFGMIGGASIAFMTSVWGVFTSVIFNLFEKALERNIRGAISSFQNKVDYLYPRITAEQCLTNIEEFSRQSTEKLAELDEKIGHRMQEAMREASNAIRDGMEQSLTTILSPAIEKLVDNAHSGSEKALNNMLDRFLDGMGDAGNSQKIMMESVAKDVKSASDSMSGGMNQFVTQLQTQFEQITTKQSETLTNVQHVLTSQLEEQQGREIARQRILHDQLQGFKGAQEQLNEGIGSVLDSQKQQHVELTTGLESLLSRFSELTNTHLQASESMQQVSMDMKASSNQLGLLSGNIKTAADSLGEGVTDSVKQLNQVTEHHGLMLKSLQDIAQQIQEVNSSINSTASTMDSAADKAERGLTAVDKHFDQLGQSLDLHLQKIQKNLADLLSDYSDRVKAQTTDRMNTWTEQTNSYATKMVDVVRVINDVVDEIDGKLHVRRAGEIA